MEVYWYYDCALLCRKWNLSSGGSEIILRDDGLRSLKKLYVAYQTSIRRRILNLFSIPSYLPCYNSKILSVRDADKFTAASFMQQNGLNNVEW